MSSVASRRAVGSIAPPRARRPALPSREIQGPRGWLFRHWLPLVAGLGAALPVIVATIRALAAGWMPIADQGIIATRAYDVLTSHTPLLGQYSEASAVTGKATYSPGPMLYWLLALPARFGAPASLTLTMALVNAASIVGVVLLARRRGGRPLMFAAGAGVAVMCASFSAESLHDIFNPSAGLFPFTLLVFLCWSLACGDYRLLPVIVVVASFVAQCHLGFVVPSLGLLAVGLGGLAMSRGWRGQRRSLLRWALAALAAALICWSAPLVDQIVHRPGNLRALVTEATTKHSTLGATAGWRAVVRAVGVPPRWLRAPGTGAGRLSGVSGGDYGDTRLNDIEMAPSVLSRDSSVLLLAALVVVALAALHRRRGDLFAAAAIGLVLGGALAAIVSATPVKATNTLGYMLWWGSVAGMWVWLTLGWSVAVLLASIPRLGQLRVPVLACGLGLAAVVAAGAGVAAAEKPDTHRPYYRPTSALAARLDRVIPRGRAVRLVPRGGLMVAIEPTIRYTLRRHDVRALGPYARRRPGAWYELDHRRFDYVVSVNADAQPPFAPARVVARAVLTDSRGRHLVSAALSPPRAVRIEGARAGRR